MISLRYYRNQSHYCDECGKKDSVETIMCMSAGAFICADCLLKFHYRLKWPLMKSFPFGATFVLERANYEKYLDPSGGLQGGPFDPRSITKTLFDEMDKEMEELLDLMSRKQMIIKTLRRFLGDYEAFKKAFIEFMNRQP